MILQWAEEIKPSLLIAARHGAHRIDGTDLGSQAENLVRLAPCNVLLDRHRRASGPRTSPGSRRTARPALPWAPEAEVRILRVPPFAQGIARRAVEEFVLERTNGEAATVTNKRLDEAIAKLLPTHMQLIMGIGTAEEIALAEVKADGADARRTKVEGHDDDPVPADAEVEVEVSGHGPRRHAAAHRDRSDRLDRGSLGAAPARCR